MPESIGELTQLQVLNLSNNKLSVLPDSIGQLAHLRILNLSDNRLVALPESLRNIGSLEELYLHSNPELGIPAEVLGPTWLDVVDGRGRPAPAVEILEYYFRVRGGSQPLNEAKVILVGPGAVGKTSIVNRLVNDSFDPFQKKTEGIQITSWKIRSDRNEEVRLNIWDFGGQEIMHATHQFFLTQRSLYLMVLNGRKGGEDADAEYWLKLIESFGGDSPVIVVLNKIREHPFDVNHRALKQKYPSVCDFIKTDCEGPEGFEQLRKSIQKETSRLPHSRDPFPASWFAIKNRLVGMEKNYLRFDEYRSVCAELGEENRSAQESLALYLHSLGIVLNFKDDPRLEDTHVLNPHWVTNGIYRILNAKKLEKQKGEIRLDDLSEILDELEYPTGMRRFLLDLMKKFELCFTFPNDDSHYLIPELLDKQEPPEAADFNPLECLNFRYHYSVLPEGLLPRFIVRTHVLSEGLPRWHTGVILKFEANRALVKADVHDKKVFISVSGPVPARRRLMAVIRSDFERIHRDIPNLQPKEMVPLPEHPDAVIEYQKLLVMEKENEDQLRIHKQAKEFNEVVNNQVVQLDVYALLNGIDLGHTQRRERSRARAIKLFCSYSHKDENFRNDLETHLKLLRRQGRIDVWNDRKLGAGDEWAQKLDENLERAEIILLLVSADFINSDYCYENEMKRALEKNENGSARVIPVILRDVNWKTAPIGALQALPKNGRPIAKWADKDSAWRDVSEEIERVIEEILTEKGNM